MFGSQPLIAFVFIPTKHSDFQLLDLQINILAKVDANFQAPVNLFYLEDYSYNEIAGILDIPLGTVKSRIARGIAQLQGMIETRSRTDSRTTPTIP